MGIFRVPMQVGDLHGQHVATLQALVDTGSLYPVVPRPVLESLGVQPVDRQPFEMADGREVEYDLGGVWITVQGRTTPVLCLFGQPESTPLLGAVALESLGLAPDPITRKLVPYRALLPFRALL